MSVLVFKKRPFKKLLCASKKISGRNNQGRITVYHRGGGCKKINRIIDRSRYVWNTYGFVHRIEFDPKKSSLIAFITYSNGIICYMLATEGLYVGDFVVSQDRYLNKNGCSFPLKSIPVGSKISSIEGIRNSQFIRAAGCYARIISKTHLFAIVKLKSGFLRKFFLNSLASLGMVSNFKYIYRNFRKAGFFRLKGWRPVVRGVAMNPVDHPHGGGQGKTSGGRPSVTPWGLITKGKPTRRSKDKSSFVVKLKK